jgi:hypothetical protein
MTEQPLKKRPSEDKKTLFEALKKGRVYISQDYYCLAKGFSFVIENGRERATMGDDITLRSKAALRVDLPKRGKIKIMKNGNIYKEVVENAADCLITECGVYRIEVSLKVFGKYRPWIFSNPIRVIRGEEDRTAGSKEKEKSY